MPGAPSADGYLRAAINRHGQIIAAQSTLAFSHRIDVVEYGRSTGWSPPRTATSSRARLPISRWT